MMYRSNWGRKDVNQTNTLAITIRRVAFEEILSLVWPSSFNDDARICFQTREAWQAAKPPRGEGVRLQWDPDHTPAGAKHKGGRRAIQLGLSQGVCRTLWNTDRCIVRIDDITDFVARRAAILDLPAPPVDAYATHPGFTLPLEQAYVVSDPNLANLIQLSEDSRPSATAS
mmetsp:Transcript_35035/g.47330  ORF Transcript_35035/g.47330 Transcript_35035/m.47330 type:complete len:171 (-) Transcript_35035:53-565(-)